LIAQTPVLSAPLSDFNRTRSCTLGWKIKRVSKGQMTGCVALAGLLLLAIGVAPTRLGIAPTRLDRWLDGGFH
jgi:hypothetical protein